MSQIVLTFFFLFYLIVECRFNATEGTPLSLNNIKDGINLIVEVAKVEDYAYFHL